MYKCITLSFFLQIIAVDILDLFPLTVELMPWWNIDLFYEISRQLLTDSLRGKIIRGAGNNQIIHPLLLSSLKKQQAGLIGIVMPAVRLIDAVTDIAEIIMILIMDLPQVAITDNAACRVKDNII